MTTGKSKDYSTGCLLDYDYYIKDFNIVGIDLSHQPVLDSDPKINQQTEFVSNYHQVMLLSIIIF